MRTELEYNEWVNQKGSYSNLTTLQYQQSHLRGLGWTIEKLIERINSARQYQFDYINRNTSCAYRQLNARIYLKYKNMLMILQMV